MICPHCHHDAGTAVLETRRQGTAVYRRRECPHCRVRFTTREEVERVIAPRAPKPRPDPAPRPQPAHPPTPGAELQQLWR